MTPELFNLTVEIVKNFIEEDIGQEEKRVRKPKSIGYREINFVLQIT